MSTPNSDTAFKTSYTGLRTDIMELLSDRLSQATVLDVGCATGVNGNYLLDTGMATAVYGIEYDPDMARVAGQRYTRVLVGDIEAMDFASDLGSLQFDALVFGDVLEHLRDPEATLAALAPYLKPGGWAVVSVPNMQHVSALWQLAVKGYWPGNQRGIFDRTHLRVFTRKNLLELVEGAGLEVVQLKRNFRFRDRPGSRFPFYGRLLKELLPDYYTFQYVVLVRKPK